MGELFHSGRIIDLILIMLMLEAAWITYNYHRNHRGPAPADACANLAAGACLLLAVRAALVDAAWPWVALGLAAALAAHIWDMKRRWRGPATRSSDPPMDL